MKWLVIEVISHANVRKHQHTYVWWSWRKERAVNKSVNIDKFPQIKSRLIQLIQFS